MNNKRKMKNKKKRTGPFTLNAIFTRSPWGGFLQISGKDWEIK
jgi:hypothetical protein